MSELNWLCVLVSWMISSITTVLIIIICFYIKKKIKKKKDLKCDLNNLNSINNINNKNKNNFSSYKMINNKNINSQKSYAIKSHKFEIINQINNNEKNNLNLKTSEETKISNEFQKNLGNLHSEWDTSQPLETSSPFLNSKKKIKNKIYFNKNNNNTSNIRNNKKTNQVLRKNNLSEFKKQKGFMNIYLNNENVKKNVENTDNLIYFYNIMKENQENEKNINDDKSEKKEVNKKFDRSSENENNQNYKTKFLISNHDQRTSSNIKRNQLKYKSEVTRPQSITIKSLEVSPKFKKKNESSKEINKSDPISIFSEKNLNDRKLVFEKISKINDKKNLKFEKLSTEIPKKALSCLPPKPKRNATSLHSFKESPLSSPSSTSLVNKNRISSSERSISPLPLTKSPKTYNIPFPLPTHSQSPNFKKLPYTSLQAF